jgi:hypothetical protein
VDSFRRTFPAFTTRFFVPFAFSELTKRAQADRSIRGAFQPLQEYQPFELSIVNSEFVSLVNLENTFKNSPFTCEAD